MNTGKELVPVTPGQIPTADPIGKEDVPAEELTRIGKVQAEAAGAVAGHEQQLGLAPSGWNGAGLIQKLGGADRAETLRETKGEHGVGFQTKEGRVRMVVDGATSPVGEIGGVPDVVPVTVGEEEGIRFELFLFQKVEKAFGCVDGETVAAKINQVGVGGGQATGVGRGLRHRSLFLKRFVNFYDYVYETVKRLPWAERLGWSGKEKALGLRE